MPKVHVTKKQQWQEIIRLATHGPGFSDPTQFGGVRFTTEEAHAQFVRWSQSWLLPALENFVVKEKYRIQKAGGE